MKDKEILHDLQTKFGENILDASPFPKAYCPGGIENVKAIYLGCDPSNKHSTKLRCAFAHESDLPVFKQFINKHSKQVENIGLSWDTVYTQNLCRNYFAKETTNNISLWKKAAKDYWIDKLVEELNSLFPLNIPVLMSSQHLLEVLGINGFEKIKAPEFYECKRSLAIPADSNKLGRDLIPLYRGKNPNFNISYSLENKEWKNYKKQGAIKTKINESPTTA